MDGTPIWKRKRSSEEEAAPPPGTLEESEGDVVPVFVAENVRESTPEPETKAAPLGTDSELVTTYRDSASLGSGELPAPATTPEPPAPVPPWAVVQERAADLDTHNLVYYEHDGKTYLLPRSVRDDFESQKAKHGESQELVKQRQRQAGSVASLRNRGLYVPTSAEGYEPPELNTDAGVDVTDMAPEQKAEVVGGTDVSDPLAPPTRPRVDVPAEDMPRLERTAGDGSPPTERIYVQPEDIPRIGRTGGGDPPPPERVYVPPEEIPRIEGVDRPPVRADLPTLDHQRIPDRLRLPGETLLAAPVQDEPTSRRLPEPPPGAPKPKRFKAAPRPDGSYPQTTGHSEVVGHLWDPSAERITSGRVAMSEPVVTRWGDDPSPRDERDVGGWDLQPKHDGIDAALDEHEVVTVSPVMARRLRAEAEKRPSEPVVAYEVVSYEHDLPSGVTTPSRRVHVQEEVADDATVGWFEPEVHAEPDAGARRVHTQLRNGTPALNRSPHEGNAALLMAAAQLARAATKEKPKPKQHRRKSAKREEPRRRGFTAPQVVVIQESGTPKRFGL